MGSANIDLNDLAAPKDDVTIKTKPARPPTPEDPAIQEEVARLKDEHGPCNITIE